MKRCNFLDEQMDAIKKLLNLKCNEKSDHPPKRSTFGNEFRKPVWFDDCESDDELSERKGFQMFTNPMEIQKYFEQQIEEMLNSFEMTDENGKIIVDTTFRENFFKPSFEDLRKHFSELNEASDTDLDDEIYADQLHSLLQRISPELERASNMRTSAHGNKNARKTDEETIWDRIHGTFEEQTRPKPPQRKLQLFNKLPHRGGVFEGAFQGPRSLHQSVMTQVIRKPDGSMETYRTVRDAEGNKNMTVTKRSSDGKVETFNYPGSVADRNVFVTNDGYVIPKLW
ncbi:hypothetical protein Bhyg_02856 [Pseudolycoriella hygida]|uniref:Uncharacterized protein n=1 Tax=Pseudolycoriella hygida TaxID=35572 RepID=A0A9Q0S864_9DIPT|nr:hypothetical protein Bhyg_02856 [Pseudolycoriella hygida]